jgi:hypothetical protein
MPTKSTPEIDSRVEWRAYDEAGQGHAIRKAALAPRRHPCGEAVRDIRFAWPTLFRCAGCIRALLDAR